MRDYFSFLQLMDIPESLRAVARGSTGIPIVGSEPAGDFAFPPALLPLWTDGAVGFGLWIHWDWRGRSFVRLSRETLRALEIARTEEQLFRWVCQAAICFSDGVTPKIKSFAEEMSVNDLAELDEMTLEFGDNPAGLLKLDAFTTAPPAACFQDEDPEYSGEMPLGSRSLEPQALAKICGYELSDRMRASLVDRAQIPSWLQASSQISVFEECLSSGDLSGAWFSLSSPGWRFSDAAKAILELSQLAENPEFTRWAQLWAEINGLSSDHY